MPEISIIIPVYGCEDYLRDCVDSVLAQTYEDYELILVDDGSPDGSGAICDEYAAKDGRVKAFHKENGGSSDARNYGLDRATGKYIGFIDSDDKIDPDMYELLRDILIKEDADMSMCGIKDIYDGVVQEKNTEKIYKVMDASESIRIVFEAKIMSVTPVNKLYKKELFDDVRFPVGKDLGEDASISVDLLMRCKRTVLTTEAKYYYIHREGSITTREFRPEDMSVIYAYKKNYKLIKEHYPENIDVAGMRVCWAYFFVLDKLLISSNRKDYKETEKELVRFLRKKTGFIIKDKSFHKTRKMATLVLRFNVGLYRKIVERTR